MGMTAKMFLSREPLSTDGAGKGPLSCMATDVSLHDSFLLGSVWTEWAPVKLNWHYQAVTCGEEKERNLPDTQLCVTCSLTLLLQYVSKAIKH